MLQWPPKGYDSPYDPMNHDPEVYREYGGYMDEGGRYSSGRGGDRYADRFAYGCCTAVEHFFRCHLFNVLGSSAVTIVWAGVGLMEQKCFQLMTL